MDSGREQNYWPAFVDALSNVVLTLVFVLVIFVFALVLESQKVAQKLQSNDQEAQQAQNDALRQQVAQLSSELAKMQQQTPSQAQQAISDQNQNEKITVKDETPDKTNAGPVSVQGSQNSITLTYPMTVVKLDQQSEDKLGHVLQTLETTTGKHKVIMRSFVGNETYSVAHRLAYYRAIRARNYLIQQMGEPPDAISISIVTPSKPEEGHVEIVFEKQ